MGKSSKHDWGSSGKRMAKDCGMGGPSKKPCLKMGEGVMKVTAKETGKEALGNSPGKKRHGPLQNLAAHGKTG